MNKKPLMWIIYVGEVTPTVYITISKNREIYNAEAENAWEGKTNFQQGFLKSYSNSVVELSRREIGWAFSCRNLNSMKVITLANLETWQKQQGKHCKRLSWLGIPSKKYLCDSGCFLYHMCAFRLGRVTLWKVISVTQACKHCRITWYASR